MPKWAIWAVVGVALLLRVVGLGHYPAGFSADEVNQGYTAYSILKTGKDEWGKFLPLAPRSYGDFRAPLYTYLVVPSVAVLGLNEFAVRFPNAILGTAAVLIVYFLVLKLFNDKRLALLTSLLLAVSPWHISLSRGAFEPNLPTFLLPLGWLAFEKGRKSLKWIIFSALIFGVSLFSYYSARFLIPVFVLVLLNEVTCNFEGVAVKGFFTRRRIFTCIFGLFLILAALTMLVGGGVRSSDVAITNPTGGWGEVADTRYAAVKMGLPDSIARVFSNKAVYLFDKFFTNYLSFFSPQFLFTSGAGEATYGMMPGIGLLYLFELPFVILGAYFMVTKANKYPFNVLILWLLIASVPAALSKGPGFPANRVALMMPLVQLVSAFGLVWMLDKLKPISHKKVIVFLYSTFLAVSVVFFIQKYLYRAPDVNARSMSYGMREAFEYVNQVSGNYDKILISRNFSEPQMFTAFYTRADPLLVQKESTDWLRYEKEGLKFVDMLGEYKLGKFYYQTLPQSSNENVLLVGKVSDFPANIKAVKVINYPNKLPAILIVDFNQQQYAFSK